MKYSDCCNVPANAVWDNRFNKVFYNCPQCKNACTVHELRKETDKLLKDNQQ